MAMLMVRRSASRCAGCAFLVLTYGLALGLFTAIHCFFLTTMGVNSSSFLMNNITIACALTVDYPDHCISRACAASRT
jgi:hypothetical protein